MACGAVSKRRWQKRQLSDVDDDGDVYGVSLTSTTVFAGCSGVRVCVSSSLLPARQTLSWFFFCKHLLLLLLLLLLRCCFGESFSGEQRNWGLLAATRITTTTETQAKLGRIEAIYILHFAPPRRFVWSRLDLAELIWTCFNWHWCRKYQLVTWWGGGQSQRVRSCTSFARPLWLPYFIFQW